MNSTKAEEPHPKPFRSHKLEATRERYAKVWARLILFCLRVVDEPSFACVCQFSNRLEEDITDLRDAIHFNRSEQQIRDRILRLSIGLITQSDYNKEYSIVKLYAGILGYNVSEARWLKAQEYTPTLARILFCMQVLGLENALPMEERETMELQNDPPDAKLNRFRSIWLVENRPSPFNALHKLLNYGLTAAKDGVGNHWIRIDAEEEWLYYKGESLSIAKLKKFQQIILGKAESILSRSLLFRKNDTVPDINPYQFEHEDFSNLNMGYYFADIISGWRKTNRTAVLNNLAEDSSRWNLLVDKSASTAEFGIVWRPEGIRDYDNTCKEFLQCLVVAMNMQGGEAGRGEEMMAMTYKNTADGERNLKIDSGQVVLETVYHKSQAMMDSLKVTF
jgi:hypothetical protein